MKKQVLFMLSTALCCGTINAVGKPNVITTKKASAITTRANKKKAAATTHTKAKNKNNEKYTVTAQQTRKAIDEYIDYISYNDATLRASLESLFKKKFFLDTETISFTQFLNMKLSLYNYIKLIYPEKYKTLALQKLQEKERVLSLAKKSLRAYVKSYLQKECGITQEHNIIHMWKEIKKTLYDRLYLVSYKKETFGILYVPKDIIPELQKEAQMLLKQKGFFPQPHAHPAPIKNNTNKK